MFYSIEVEIEEKIIKPHFLIACWFNKNLSPHSKAAPGNAPSQFQGKMLLHFKCINY